MNKFAGMNKSGMIKIGVIFLFLVLIFVLYHAKIAEAFCRVGITAFNTSGSRVDANYTGYCEKQDDYRFGFQNQSQELGYLFSWGGPFDDCDAYCGNVFVNASNSSMNKWGRPGAYPMNSSTETNWGGGGTFYKNVTLNLTLSSPGNSTTEIISPLNNSLFIEGDIFNVTVNVSALVNDIGGCEVNLTVSNYSVLNITTTNPVSLGDIGVNDSKIANFNISSIGPGVSNITALTTCTSGGDSNASVSNITIQALVLNVNLISPSNNTESVNFNQTFVCNSTSNVGLSNSTLYVWNSTGLFNTTTKTISGTFNETSFNLTDMPLGNYTWNCLVYDSSINSNWAVSNWTYSVITDTQPPSVVNLNIIPPVANQTNLINITVNVSDDYSGVDSVLANITFPDNSSTLYSMSNSSEIYNLTFGDTMQIGIYYVRILANDTNGNLNDSETGSFTINSAEGYGNSTTEILNPLNDTIHSLGDIIDVSINVSAVGGNLSECNVTLSVSNSSVLNITTTNPVWLGNFSEGESKIGEFNVSVIGLGVSNISAVTACYFGGGSSAKTINQTVLYNDTQPPSVVNLNIIPPVANQTNLINITVNVSDDYSGVDSVLANITFPDNSSTLYSMSNSSEIYNLTFGDTMQIGIYYVRILANDTKGNLNDSETGSFTINSAEGYGNSTTNITTPTNDSIYGLNSAFDVYVNVSAVGGNLSECNVTLSVSNSSVLNIVSTNPELIGNLTDSASNLTWFNVSGIAIGSSDITATTSCLLGGGSYNTTYNIQIVSQNTEVNLISPSNGTSSLSTNQTFICNATSGAGLVNSTLYVWNSTGLFNTTTKTISGTFNETSFNLTDMPLGNYTWNCFVGGSFDSAWALNNFSLEIKNATLGWLNVSAPEGVFEPDNGTSYTGTHVHTMGIVFEGLTIKPANVLRCDIKMADGTIRVVNTSGIDLLGGNYTLNYTVQTSDSIIFDNDVGYIPWILKNCSILNGGSVVYLENNSYWASFNKSARIYVHNPGLWDDSEVTRAVSCANNPGKYFNNSEKCTFSGDTMFALQMRNGNPTEESCYNNIGVGCSNTLCTGLPFASCRSPNYHSGYSAYVDDPNGFASYTETVGSYTTHISYTRYVNSSGQFKLRISQSALGSAKAFTFTIVNLTNVSGANIYGPNQGNGVLQITQNGPNNYNINYENLSSGAYSGSFDFVFNVTFDNQSLFENQTFYVTIAYGIDTNQNNEQVVDLTFDPNNGYRNFNEGEGTGSIFSNDAGNRCGDEANNDFDYLGGTWANSYDCFDVDCDGIQGDDSQTNEFGSGKTGLCNYAVEMNCTDGFDNDYDYIAGTDYTDCHDSDCFMNDSKGCPSVETVCNDSINNDWDYTLGEGDNSGDEKIENNGTKYDSTHQADLTDCEDIDCNGQIGGSNGELCSWGKETNCSDGFDNDALQLYDCQVSSVGSSTATVTPANAEYDCAVYCRTNNVSTETGSTCMDNIDNDWDAVILTGNYSDQYIANSSYGAGTDCRWGGYWGIGTDYNPDEDCNATTLPNGFECQLKTELNCTDGFDNDFDHDASGMPHAGWTQSAYEAYFGAGTYSNDADFDDYDCAGQVTYNESTNASWCFDGIDNDLDAYYFNGTDYVANASNPIDCGDPDCDGVVNPNNPNQSCSPYEYNASASSPYNNPMRCNDGADNDADSLTDCADSDCFAQFDLCSIGQCKKNENVTWDSCFDGNNNDYQDGTDCADSDCVGMFGSSEGALCSAGESGNFSCSDGFDNDVDGNADCRDPGCVGYLGGKVNGLDVLCEAIETSCSDGFDNDGDGDVDCYDSDCNSACGLGNVVGSSIVSLPQYSGQITLNGINPSTQARVEQSTDEIRRGENYTIRLRGIASADDTQWTIGTGSNPFDKSKFDTTTATLTGPDASTFTLTETSNGWTIDETASHPSGYDITFVVTSTTTMSASNYELTYAESVGSLTSLNNNINYEVHEDTAPVVQEINVSAQQGIFYGGSLQVRANASDNNQFGRCEFVVYGAGSFSGNSNNCKWTFSPSVEGTYYINATPRDHYDNVGTTVTQSYNLDILPTGSSTLTDEEFYHPTDLVSFNASFNVVGTDTIGNGNIYAKNESGNYFLGSCSASGNSCVNSSLNISSLGDGIYTIYANVTETTENDVVESLGKGIFICSGTSGICAFADFDGNGKADICVSTPPSVENVSALPNPINQTENVDISANVTDDGIVSGVLAQITYPDLTSENWSMNANGSIYSLAFNNTLQTGLYFLRIIAIDDESAVNDSETTNFTSLVKQGYGNSTTEITEPLNGASYNTFNLFNVSVNISAVGGDLSNCSVRLNIPNKSIINFSVGEEETHLLGNLTNGNNYDSTWELQAVGNGTLEITTTTSCYFGGSSYDKINLTSIADLLAPSVTNVSAMPSVINQTESLNLSANVTDNKKVSTVLAIINYPDLVNRTFVMNNATSFDIYEYLFSDSLQTGTYAVRIFANDTTNNINASETTSFSVNVWPGFGSTTTSITTPSNDSAYNASDTFEVNATISGTGNLENCTAEINFNESVLSVVSDTIYIGDLADNSTNVSWNVLAKSNVSTTITVSTYCERGGSSYDKLFNITVYGAMNMTSIDAPVNFTINGNNTAKNMVLNWSSVSGADGYKIWYSDNVTEILQLDDESSVSSVREANVTTTNTGWIDTTANLTQQRYYAVAAYVGDTMNISVDKMGKYDIEIANESTKGHDMISLPLEQNISFVDAFSSLDDGASITIANNSATFVYSFYHSALGGWNYHEGLIGFEFGKGYYTDNFVSSVKIVNYGKVPTGNYTQIIENESSKGHDMIGWMSLTPMNFSTVLPSPDDGASITIANDSATFVYSFYHSALGGWNYHEGLDHFEPGKGYYTDNFVSPTNMTYERNPH